MENQRISHGKAFGQLVCVQDVGDKNAPDHEYVGVAVFVVPGGKGFGLTGLDSEDYNGLLDFVGKNIIVSFSGDIVSDDPLLILVESGIEVQTA